MNPLYFEIMQPNETDADCLRLWRNEPTSLEMSCTYTETKSLKEFFPEYLRNYFSYPNLPSLFARKEGARVGALRFDPVDTSQKVACEISIIVSPEHRGKGIASEILIDIDPFLKRQGIEVIYARIKSHNIASIKAFKKAGYKEVSKGDIYLLEKVLNPPQASPVFVIAEAGSNWKSGQSGKDLERALKMIDIAKDAGADAVKFQTFQAKDTYVEKAGQSDYLSKSGIKQDIFQLIKEMEMPKEMIPLLAKHCQKVGIEFMSSVFSVKDFDLIDPYVKRHKIASYEITHSKLIVHAAKSKKPLILSTGASKLSDIDWAVDTFFNAGGKDLTLLQCTAKYPAESDEMHLNVIPFFKSRYALPIGLSDHSLQPIEAPLGAVALGAKVIEKHFTMSRSLIGPDHAYAIEPFELKAMVEAIRALEKMKGSPLKEVHSGEKELYYFAKRGIQALRDIRRGEILVDEENIAILRPGKQSLGLHPKYLPEIEGKAALRDIKAGSGISFEDWK